LKPWVVVAADFVKTGGMDRANYALAKRLAERGVETHLVGYTAADTLLAHDRIRFHRVPKLLNSYLAGEPLLDRCGRAWAARLGVGGGRVVVNGGNCAWNDVNWVHYVHAAAYSPLEGDPGRRSSQATPLLRRMKNRLQLRLALAREKRIVRQARLVIANSRKTATDLRDRLDIPPALVCCVYLGIDSELFHAATHEERARARFELDWPSERPLVLFVGGLGDHRKGFDTLFNAWRRLRADPSWDAELVVVGAGAEAASWRRRAADHDIMPSIRFLGSRNDVPRLLAACDVMVAPTRYESYGLAVQEALCCGLPSLVTRDAGIAEQYPPSLQQLLLNDPNDDVELAERLKRWRVQPALFRSELEALAAKLRSHTWDNMADEFISLVEEQQ
jgi:glycosyltransferase involved in cell wall biosynthesis